MVKQQRFKLLRRARKDLIWKLRASWASWNIHNGVFLTLMSMWSSFLTFGCDENEFTKNVLAAAWCLKLALGAALISLQRDSGLNLRSAVNRRPEPDHRTASVEWLSAVTPRPVTWSKHCLLVDLYLGVFFNVGTVCLMDFTDVISKCVLLRA